MPPPRIILKNIVNSKRFRNLKKNLHQFVELVEANPLIYYNTLHFDQYSSLAICLNIFRFSANNLKTNLEKKAFCNFEELVKTNRLMYNIKDLR